MQAQELPWTTLVPARDTRDAEMQAWDEADTRHMIQTINQSEDFAQGHFRWSRLAISDLLGAPVPFADLHFDSVHPMELTSQEKSVLREWIERGGFLLAFEDTYPYEQEEFRQARSLPVFDFFIKELPAADPRYTVERATDQHPIFRASTRPRAPKRSNARCARILTIAAAPCSCTMVASWHFLWAATAVKSPGAGFPWPVPFAPNLGFELRSYYLMLNIYIYALNH